MKRAIIITSHLEYQVNIRELLQPDDYIVCLDGGFDILQRQGLTPDLLLGDFDSLRTPLPECLENAKAGHSLEIHRYPPEKDYTDLELAFRTLDPAKTPELLVIGGLGGRLDQTLINIQLLQRYTAPVQAQTSHTCASKTEPDMLRVRQPESGDLSSGEAPFETPFYGSFRQYRRIEIMDGHHRCFVLHAGQTAEAGAPGQSAVSACPMPDDSSPGAPAASKPPFVAVPRQPDCYLSVLPLTEECSGVDLEGVKYPIHDAVLRRGSSLSVSNEFLEDTAQVRLLRGSLLVMTTKRNSSDCIS